jgi:lipopolysaccharide transport system ATP-binding protein
MSSETIALSVNGVGKCYHIYERPSHRLKEFFLPRLQAAFGRQGRKYSREFWALQDISFQVRKGEQVGIVGRNGAGKSTLLQIICGTLTPTMGSVEARGRIAALLELGAGFNPELNGIENIYLNGAVLGLSREEMDDRYERILKFADIGDFVRQPVKNYSSGMYMRLAFAVAVHVDPEVLVVDEALSVGDEAFQRKCNLKIRELKDNGTTVLFVSHSASHVIEVCTRALLIDKGKLVAEGDPKKVVAAYHRMLLAANKGEENAVAVAVAAGELQSNEVDDAADIADREPEESSFYDPGLVPTTTVVYPTQGCTIIDPHLQTPSGTRVNVLSRGNEYVYTYRAVFDSSAAAVRFGMMIRTLRGIDLGGAVSTHEAEPHDFFQAGSTVTIKFRFVALMEHGVYFCNAGVVSLLHGEEKYLARVVDAIMFRVLRDDSSLSTGMVDFHVMPSVMLQN